MAKRVQTGRSGGPGSKERGKTRALLMDAGLRLFSRKGFDGVGVSELEEAVGLKPGSGSFYRHFADKGALLKAIMEHEIELAHQRRSGEQSGLMETGRDIRTALAAQFRLTLQGLRQKTELINLLSRGADHFPALLRELRKSFVQDGLQTIAEAYHARIQAGDLVEADPQALAAVVQSALYGYISAEAIFGKPANAQAAEEALIATLVQLLVRPTRGKPARTAGTVAAASRSKNPAGAPGNI
jgi:AcrR family transcriptional regulator